MPETPSSPSPEPGPDAPTTEAPTTAGPPPGGPAPRRLLRSRDDRVVAGVCGGLAKYFNIDPLIVRIAAVALSFVGGASVIAYIAAVLLVPEDDGTGRPVKERPGRAATIAGAVLVVLAGIALLNGAWGPHIGWGFGPLASLILVAALLALAGQRLLGDRGGERPTAGRIAAAIALTLAALCGAAVAAAAAAWATAAGGGTFVAALVIALGVAMIALSFRSRSALWLAVPALVLAIPSGVVAAADVDVRGGIGERTYRPVDVADLRPGGYKLGTGELVLDLRDLRWPADAPVHAKVDVGMGHALVLVPSDVCVQSATHVGAGYVDVLGHESAGADVDDETGTVARAHGPKLVLDAKMGFGAVEVLHQRYARDFGPHNGRGSIDRRLADAGCGGARA